MTIETTATQHLADPLPSRLAGPTRPPTPVALALFVQLQIVVHGRTRLRTDRGQATTEYALVLLAAALVGLMVVAWATAGGGAARISRLFNGVIDAVIDRV